MKRDKIACSCRNITYGKIEDAVKAGATTPEQVKEATSCGGSCGRCMEIIEYLIRDILLEM